MGAGGMASGAGSIATVRWGQAPARASAMVKRPSEGQTASAAVDLTTADDRTLVEAFQSGQREAFDVIVTRHRRQVYQLCFRFLHDHEDAADLAQDVFVRAFKGLRKFKGDASLATWLYRVSVNACLNRVSTKRPVATPIEAAGQLDAKTADPLQEVLRGERAEAVRVAIAKLPPKQRATLLLRIYQDCSHEEIATALGSTVGAAKANLFHALGNLRRALRSI